MNDLIPPEFYLGQNYPNPFSEKTIIKYCVAYQTKVRITIYDSEGEMIDKLVDEVKEPGTYEVEFSMSELKKCDNQVSNIQNRVSSLPSREHGIRHPVSGIQHRVSSNRHPVFIPLFYQMKAGDYLSEKEMRLVR